MDSYDPHAAQAHKAYFIMNEHGEVLTNVEDSNRLEWTFQAAMEDANEKAVLYKNPFHIPQRIASQFDDHFMVYEIEIRNHKGFAAYEDTLDARCIGLFGQFNPKHPALQNRARQQQDYMARALGKQS